MTLRFLPVEEVTHGRFKGHKHAFVGPSDDESLEPWSGYDSKRPIVCEDCIAELDAIYIKFYEEARARYRK